MLQKLDGRNPASVVHKVAMRSHNKAARREVTTDFDKSEIIHKAVHYV